MACGSEITQDTPSLSATANLTCRSGVGIDPREPSVPHSTRFVPHSSIRVSPKARLDRILPWMWSSLSRILYRSR